MIVELSQSMAKMRTEGRPADLEPETVDGVVVERKLFCHDRKETRWTVRLDGTEFACEIERWPWNIFRPVTTEFWVWTGLTSHTMYHKLIPKLPEVLGSELKEYLRTTRRSPRRDVKRMCVIEDFYPPEGLPMHYNVWTRTIEDVVAVWKAYLDAFGSYGPNLEKAP
jgi:hypothetical protein